MISRFALCAVLLAILTNCEPNQLDYTLWPDYKAYQSQSHYRAFAIAPADMGGKNGATQSWVMGSASDEKSVQAAIDTAMANCEAKESPHKCRWYAIGNIEVSGLIEPQLDRAIAVYAENPSTTNADLLANAAEAE
jgi:hypothetical protein